MCEEDCGRALRVAGVGRWASALGRALEGGSVWGIVHFHVARHGRCGELWSSEVALTWIRVAGVGNRARSGVSRGGRGGSRAAAETAGPRCEETAACASTYWALREPGRRRESVDMWI